MTGFEEATLGELIARFDAAGAASELDPMHDRLVRLADEIAADARGEGQLAALGRLNVPCPDRCCAFVGADGPAPASQR